MIGRRDTDALDQLTPREHEVLRLMAEGRSNRGIAETLVVTEDAVEKHVNHLLRKLDITGAPTDHRRVIAAARRVARFPLRPLAILALPVSLVLLLSTLSLVLLVPLARRSSPASRP